MSFEAFFSLFESSKPFDVTAYKRNVKAGQTLASEIGDQLVRHCGAAVPDDVKRAIMQAQLIAAIDDPVNVLQHLARYLALKGDFWAAGKLHDTYTVEAQRRKRQQGARRKGARSANVKRKSDRAYWIEAAVAVGRRIRATQEGARLSGSELARRIVAAREFRSLETRQPSWRTVRVELPALKLSRAVRRRKRGA